MEGELGERRERESDADSYAARTREGGNWRESLCRERRAERQEQLAEGEIRDGVRREGDGKEASDERDRGRHQAASEREAREVRGVKPRGRRGREFKTERSERRQCD
ncbi:hypothetical protein NL676_031741 [Syzygium grande]|nr:hypothetical protein NL676_031741 [Syzygium grande]